MSAVAGTFARDNVYIKDVEAKVGDEVTLDIYFDTETEYAAAQADIYFPEGVTPVEYKAKKWLKKAVSDRWDEDAPHGLSQNDPIQNETKAGRNEFNGKRIIRFILAEMTNARFKVGNSPMLTVKVKIEKEGVFEGGINNNSWSTGIPEENFVNDGYGPVTKFKITATSSGINDVNAAETVKARKVIENGQIYIIAGDKKYNVMGAEVK
ncbi:MAG: hypothetical protein UDD86_07790 [Sodaliphilus sp.]|nr:hypothetical protein [Sodaliphilus sp.]